MTKWRCKICGFEHPSYSEVWWHIRLEHNCQKPSEKMEIIRNLTPQHKKLSWKVRVL